MADLKKDRTRIPKAVKSVRRDLTDWLWHFVRRENDPQQALKDIIKENAVRGSLDRASAKTVISFMDAPLSEHVRQDKVLRETKYRRMSLNGVGFTKKCLFDRGALPAIYQPRRLLDSLPDHQRFRHVDYDLQCPIDYTWQREWRLEIEMLPFESDDVILVVENVAAFRDELWEIQYECDYEGPGEYSEYTWLAKNWNFIPLEYMDIQTDKDIEVCKTEDFSEIFSSLLQTEYQGDIEL